MLRTHALLLVLRFQSQHELFSLIFQILPAKFCNANGTQLSGSIFSQQTENTPIFAPFLNSSSLSRTRQIFTPFFLLDRHHTHFSPNLMSSRRTHHTHWATPSISLYLFLSLAWILWNSQRVAALQSIHTPLNAKRSCFNLEQETKKNFNFTSLHKTSQEQHY